MIVKDKAATLNISNDLAKKHIIDIFNEIKTNIPEDDPAEYIYLTIHTISNMIYRIIHVLNGYSETYGIPNTDKKTIYKMIQSVLEEYLYSNH